jgi:hypothetical protein
MFGMDLVGVIGMRKLRLVAQVEATWRDQAHAEKIDEAAEIIILRRTRHGHVELGVGGGRGSRVVAHFAHPLERHTHGHHIVLIAARRGKACHFSLDRKPHLQQLDDIRQFGQFLSRDLESPVAGGFGDVDARPLPRHRVALRLEPCHRFAHDGTTDILAVRNVLLGRQLRARSDDSGRYLGLQSAIELVGE